MIDGIDVLNEVTICSTRLVARVNSACRVSARGRVQDVFNAAHFSWIAQLLQDNAFSCGKTATKSRDRAAHFGESDFAVSFSTLKQRVGFSAPSSDKIVRRIIEVEAILMLNKPECLRLGSLDFDFGDLPLDQR